jgi:hypothetical protein
MPLSVSYETDSISTFTEVLVLHQCSSDFFTGPGFPRVARTDLMPQKSFELHGGIGHNELD